MECRRRTRPPAGGASAPFCRRSPETSARRAKGPGFPANRSSRASRRRSPRPRFLRWSGTCSARCRRSGSPSRRRACLRGGSAPPQASPSAPFDRLRRDRRSPSHTRLACWRPPPRARRAWKARRCSEPSVRFRSRARPTAASPRFVAPATPWNPG